MQLIGLTTIEVPNPNLGNQTTYELNASQNRTTGGTYHATKAGRPNLNSFTYELGVMNRTKKDDLIAWFEDNAALTVDVEDHNGDTRTGVIANDEIEFVTLEDDCSYTCSFVFVTEDTP